MVYCGMEQNRAKEYAERFNRHCRAFHFLDDYKAYKIPHSFRQRRSFKIFMVLSIYSAVSGTFGRSVIRRSHRSKGRKNV